MHPIDPVFFFLLAKGGQGGYQIFWVFVVPHVLSVNPSNAQAVPPHVPNGFHMHVPTSTSLCPICFAQNGVLLEPIYWGVEY
jgi:hypothetical protein